MKVVALKSFFGNGINAKAGKVLEVTDKLGKAWVKSGIVRVATDDDNDRTVVPQPARYEDATTSSTDETDDEKTTDEASDETSTEDVASDDAGNDDDGKPATTGEVEAKTETSEPTAPNAPVAPATTSKPADAPKADATVTKSTDDATTTTKVETTPTTSVKPAVGNTNPNAKKASK